jgi:hypothetical protein
MPIAGKEHAALNIAAPVDEAWWLIWWPNREDSFAD